MKTKYNGLLIKPYENNDLIFTRLSINRKSALKELYSALNCETIDIQERKINGKIYDFIIDDEYMINGKSQKPENITAFGMLDGKIAEVIYGAIFICGQADEDGKETDLNEEDINAILKSLVYITNKQNQEKYRVIKYEF